MTLVTSAYILHQSDRCVASLSWDRNPLPDSGSAESSLRAAAPERKPREKKKKCLGAFGRTWTEFYANAITDWCSGI